MENKFILLCCLVASISGPIKGQEKVRVHASNDSYVTTIDYITFDVADDEEIITLNEVKNALESLNNEKLR